MANRQFTTERAESRPSTVADFTCSGGYHFHVANRVTTMTSVAAGQDSSCASGVEPSKRDPVGGVEFGDQLPGDEESGDDEEDVDADVPPGNASPAWARTTTITATARSPSMSGRNFRTPAALRAPVFAPGASSVVMRAPTLALS